MSDARVRVRQPIFLPSFPPHPDPPIRATKTPSPPPHPAPYPIPQHRQPAHLPFPPSYLLSFPPRRPDPPSAAMHGRLPRLLPALRRALSTTAATPAPPSTGPNHRTLLALDGNTIRPFVQANAYVAPSASVIGSVVVNDKSAVMYGAVVRGDLAVIHVGAHVTVGDNATLHADVADGALSPQEAIAAGLPVSPQLFVGDYSSVGANASLTGCRLAGDNVVGHGATVAEGAVLERYAVVLPKSQVPEGVHIAEGEIWGGVPARKVADRSDDDRLAHRKSAEASYALFMRHAYEFLPHGFGYLEKEKLEAEAEGGVTPV